jgi:hypothetical protein
MRKLATHGLIPRLVSIEAGAGKASGANESLEFHAKGFLDLNLKTVRHVKPIATCG